MDRVYHSYKLPGDSSVLDILRHYKLDEKLKKLDEELKKLKEELTKLKEKLDPDHQSIRALTNYITSLMNNTPSAPVVDSSKYEFSSCSWGDISIDTQCSDLFDKGIGKDIKSAIHIIEKGENSLPFLVALF